MPPPPGDLSAATSPSPVLRIAIVNPDFSVGFFSFHHGFEVLGGETRCAVQTGALPTLAGLLDPRHDIHVFDEAVEPLDFATLADFDVIGVTGMIVQRTRMLEILQALRGVRGKVVVGGPLATAEPERFEPLCDVLFIGEADETWPVFIEDLAHGRETARRYQQAERTDMSRVPVPRFDLLDAKRYGSVSIQFSRGCPFLCEFCDIIVMFGRRPRIKTVPQVIAELEVAHAAGFRECFLVDDNFIGNKAAAKELLRAIIEWQHGNGFAFRFMIEASVNLAEDQELLTLLVAAGVTQIFVGVETPNPAALLETRKTQNLRGGSLLERLDRIRHAGLIIRAGFILGFDADTPAVFEAQFDFITQAAIPIAMVGILTPLPTTPLHARLEREGRLVPEDPLCSFEPAQMSRDTLKRGARDLIIRVYDPDNFFDRVFRSFDGPASYQDHLAADRERRGQSSHQRKRETLRIGRRLVRIARREGHPEVVSAYLRNWRVNKGLGRLQLPKADFVQLCVIHWHLYRIAHSSPYSTFNDLTGAIPELA